MLLKAGFVSIALLLASRLLGLLRESAQAAAFGTSGLGDVAVLMLTLPDWVAGVLASGALAYVLLPHWATQSPAGLAQSQRRVAQGLLATGLLVAALLWLFQAPLSQWLASGVPPDLRPQAAQGLVWSAVAVPAALLAALWGTRLQYERDFAGLYSANLVVNGVVIVALYLIAYSDLSIRATTLLGIALWLAMVLRLLWLHWCLQAFGHQAAPAALEPPGPLPRASLWLWAALSSGLPLTLPFVARSLASGTGEGALVTFNYAWKLVELPLVLAVQLVATLSFPAIARALASDPIGSAEGPSQIAGEALRPLSDEAVRTLRGAFLIAWTLACACTAALQVGAPVIAQWLFGWGRMPAESLVTVAHWGALGAWGLLPQAMIAVTLTVLASIGRMRPVVLAYAVALGALVLLGVMSGGAGAFLMLAINGLLCLVALVAWLNLPTQGAVAGQRLSLLPWQAMMVPTAILLTLVLTMGVDSITFFQQKSLLALIVCVLIAILVIAAPP